MSLSVSVITPSYNQGEFIERTIQSVLSQDARDVQYLVVDGGSDDATLEILLRYSGQLEWLSEEDRGQAHAVNKGVAATSGDVIGWLNSDDVYYDGAVRSSVDFLEAHPDLDGVYGDAQFIDSDGQPLEPYHTESWDLGRLFELCYICQPTVFVRRDLVQRVGQLDEKLQYCLDYEYWLRSGMAGARFGYLRRLQAGYRLHSDSKSVGSRALLHAEINTMLRDKLGRTPDEWLRAYGRAVAEFRGVRPNSRIRFAAVASAISWNAALRLNRRISRRHLAGSARWVASSARTTLAWNR